jgi:hypothetical protein
MEIIIFDWNEHYKTGGKSGEPEDYEISRPWKKNIISMHCDIKTDSFIDIGCGDLQFWNGEIPVHYTGIDISPVIIQKNKSLYPDAIFIVSNAIIPRCISANVVMCFDMLWHILDDDDYIKILINMKKYSKKYIIIYTWNRNVFGGSIWNRLITGFKSFRHGGLSFKVVDNDGGYQKYRNFLKFALPVFSPEFKLLHTYTNDHWTVGTMYVFQRVRVHTI